MKNKILHSIDTLYLACIWISGLSVFVMSLIIPWGIFTRYVLGTGSAWPEPVAVMLMVVFTFFGASAAYRARSHIAVALITDQLPIKVQDFLLSVVDVLMLSVALFVTWYGSKLCLETWGQNVGEIPWMPVGATYLPVPLGGLTTVIFVLEHMIFGPQDKRAVVTYDHEKVKAEAV
ncbi:MAG: tripartite ATP-independent periplasmic transporter DctQ [Comamonadaceae bacterium]|nr:MAG: tripartite ATP-independent periplasmic transporter DctQ [Comamonadaceae bacterium]